MGAPGMRAALLPAVSYLDPWRLRALLDFRRRPAFIRSVAIFGATGGYLAGLDRRGA